MSGPIFEVKIGVLPSAQQLDALFTAIGWRSRGEAKWQLALSKSSCITSVWQQELLVGFGRLLEDGVMCMLYDIGVLPSKQRKGIGTLVMNQLVQYVQAKEFASIGLWAWHQNPANLPFYQRFGFIQEPGGMELKRLMKPE